MNSACSTTYELFCGKLLLHADEQGITGISFAKEGERQLPKHIPTLVEEHLQAAKAWLDAYQDQGKPGSIESKVTMPEVKLHIAASPFQRAVWAEAMKIPFGETITYSQMAQRVAQRLGKEQMSAQAIGGALKRNPVVLIIPCHRIVGANGRLGGYMGTTGTMLKRLLLDHEGVELGI